MPSSTLSEYFIVDIFKSETETVTDLLFGLGLGHGLELANVQSPGKIMDFFQPNEHNTWTKEPQDELISKLSVIAAFDFDGTLSYKDAMLPFFCFVKGPGKTCLNLMLELPQLAGYPFSLTSRQAVKESLIRRFLGGMTQEEAFRLGVEFAQTRLKQLVKPEGLQRIQWHLQQRHRCILISAGLDLYLNPWGKNAGFQDIITSSCEFDKDGLITGRLAQTNCWGMEKARRLTTLVGPKAGYLLYAYGNSRGDKELLDMADFPFYRKFH